MAPCCSWSSLACSSAAQRLSVSVALSAIPSPLPPSSYKLWAPGFSCALCTPLHRPFMWLFLLRKLSSGNFKRVTEIWGQVPAIIPITPKWKLMSDLTVGLNWKHTLAPHETPGTFFSLCEKVKLQKKAGVEKKSSLLPHVRIPCGVA